MEGISPHAREALLRSAPAEGRGMSEFQMRVEVPAEKRRGPRSGTKLQKVLAFARQRPGEWCAVAEYANEHTASSIANKYKRSSDATYEWCSRGVTEDGKTMYRVYCRYTPPATEAA